MLDVSLPFSPYGTLELEAQILLFYFLVATDFSFSYLSPLPNDQKCNFIRSFQEPFQTSNSGGRSTSPVCFLLIGHIYHLTSTSVLCADNQGHRNLTRG